jgi:hypothetical protein
VLSRFVTKSSCTSGHFSMREKATTGFAALTVVLGMTGGCGGSHASSGSGGSHASSGSTPQQVVDLWNTPGPKPFPDSNPNARFDLIKEWHVGPFVSVTWSVGGPTSSIRAGFPLVTFSQGETSNSVADQWTYAPAPPSVGWTMRAPNWWERGNGLKLEGVLSSAPEWNATLNSDGTLTLKPGAGGGN